MGVLRANVSGSWVDIPTIGPAGPQGPAGAPGAVPEAPTDGQSYSRRGSDASWQVAASGGGGISDAPNDGTTYARKSLAWAHLTHSDITDWATTLAGYLPLTGGTLTGPLAGTAATFSGLSTLSGGASVSGSATFGVGSGGAGTGLTVNNALLARQLNTSGNTFAIASTAITPLLFTQSIFSGTVGAGAQNDINRMAITTDTVDASAGADNTLKALNIVWNLGAAAKGGRNGLNVNISAVADLLNNMEIVAVRGNLVASHNMGGANLQPFASVVQLKSGSSNVSNTLSEIDYSVEAGAAAPGVKGGLLIALSRNDAVAGPIDAGLFFSNSNNAGVSPGMGMMIAAGTTNQGWPVNPTTGTVLGVLPQLVNQAGGRNAPFIPTSAFAGADFSPVNFSRANGYSFRGPGFSADGTGQVRMSNALFGTTAAGVQIDVSSQRVSAAAVAAGGGGGGGGTNDYYVGDILLTADGTQVRVATVAAGAVTGVTLLVPGVASSPPANPVATTSGSGINATLTLTWSTLNQLSLNPSGGPVTAPTPAPGTNTTAVATTAFVAAAVPAALVAGSPGSFSTIAATGAITPAQPAGIVGTTATGPAAAGSVGEFLISGAGAGVALTTGTGVNINSLVLTAGDWDVWAGASFAPAATTTVAALLGSISLTSGSVTTAINGTSFQFILPFTTGVAQILPVGAGRVSVAASTTIYLNVQANFGVSTMTATGPLMARRRR
jgi:hypothetical protein